MDKLLNKQDIIQFINQEKKKPTIPDIHKSFKLFIKIMYKSLYDIYIKIKDLDINFNNLINSGSLLIYHVYWIIYTNSYNIKLTMFLTERCVLLFTEFIIMSRNPILNNDLNFIPDINDAMHFSLKKTVGTLKVNYCKNKKISELLTHYRNISIEIKLIFKSVLSEILNYNVYSQENKESFIKGLDYISTDNDILKVLEKTSIIINKNLISNYNIISGDNNQIFSIISSIFNLECPLVHKLFLMKITFDLFERIQNICLVKGSTTFINELYLNILEFKKYLIIENLSTIHKKKFFRDLLKKYILPEIKDEVNNH